MMFKKLAAVTSALLFASSIYAGQITSCPDINEIKAEGISMAQPIMESLFFTYHFSFYNTNNNWAFAIAPIEADTEEVAIDLANEVLDNINSSGIPDNSGKDVVCYYDTGRPDILAAAMQADFMSPNKLKQHILKAR